MKILEILVFIFVWIPFFIWIIHIAIYMYKNDKELKKHGYK